MECNLDFNDFRDLQVIEDVQLPLDSESIKVEQVTEKAQGGIIGTAFVKILLENKDWKEKSEAFIKSIK